MPVVGRSDPCIPEAPALELLATRPGLAATKLRPCLIMSGLSCITWHARASSVRDGAGHACVCAGRVDEGEWEHATP